MPNSLLFPFSQGSFIDTAEKVRLPDDCTIGYIIEGLLGVKMQHSNLFHSHLENLQRLPRNSLLQQVCYVLYLFFTLGTFGDPPTYIRYSVDTVR